VDNDEPAFGEIYLDRSEDRPVIEDQRSGVTGLELVKVKGSSFTGYVQDEYTTLSEREDRTLFISLDIFRAYENAADALGEDPERYVPAKQVRDIAHVMFHEVNGNSIQDLSDRSTGSRMLPTARIRQLRGEQPHLDRGARRHRG
jgi:urate oxidase